MALLIKKMKRITFKVFTAFARHYSQCLG